VLGVVRARGARRALRHDDDATRGEM
jgi:hypothetical protein